VLCHCSAPPQVNCDTGQQAVPSPDHFRQVAAATQLTPEQQQQLRSAFKVSSGSSSSSSLVGTATYMCCMHTLQLSSTRNETQQGVHCA
jgi:hypothetical protein